MTDIVERLRAIVSGSASCFTSAETLAMREAVEEIERLRAAYDSRGGEMDSMRMVLAETQKWNEERCAEVERLRAESKRLQAALIEAAEMVDETKY